MRLIKPLLRALALAAGVALLAALGSAAATDTPVLPLRSSLVRELFTGTLALAHNWRLDEATAGSPVIDSQGGQNGLPNQTPGPTDDPTPTATIKAPLGTSLPANLRSYRFDGGDHVEVPSSAENTFVDGESFSIALWVRKEVEQGDWVRLVGKGVTGDLRNYGVWEEWGGNQRILFQIYGAGGLNLYSTGIVPTQMWTHVVCTHDGATRVCQIYINGVLSGTGTRGAGAMSNNADPLTFGRAIGATGNTLHQPLNGWMDDIRMYNTVVTQAEIDGLINKAGAVTITSSGGNSQLIPTANPVTLTAAAPSNQIWYTIDGTDPGAEIPSATAIQYAGPFNLPTAPGTRITLRARSYVTPYAAGAPSALASDVVQRNFSVAYPTTVPPTPTEPGIFYNYFYNDWGDYLPNFAVKKPQYWGLSNAPAADPINLNPRDRNDYIGFTFDGYVNAPTTGFYNFYTTSDDGSKLYIDGIELVNNDGPHGMQERTGFIGLAAGIHAIRVIFSQGVGGLGLDVRWDGPGVAKQEIPLSVLSSRVRVTTPVITSVPNTPPYSAPLPVTITCAQPGATIYYTLDGTFPTATNFNGSGPATGVTFNLSGNATVKAVAILSPYNPSDMVPRTFVMGNNPPDIVAVSAAGINGVVLVRFDTDVTAASAQTLANYSIVEDASGAPISILGATLLADNKTVRLTTGSFIAGVRYRLTVVGVTGLNLISIPPPGEVRPLKFYAKGTIYREEFTGIGGTAITDLTNNVAFPNDPTGGYRDPTFERPDLPQKDNYGTRFRGYYHPPSTANYEFFVEGDDATVLKLSTVSGREDDPTVAAQIASTNNSWTQPREWGKFTQQRSASIALDSTKRYYVEVLSKEGGGGDNCGVLVRLASAAPAPALGTLPTTGADLSPYMESPTILQQPVSSTVNVGQTVTMLVRASGAFPRYYRWFKNGVQISYVLTRNLTFASVTEADEGLYHCEVTNDVGTVTSDSAYLIVTDGVPPDLTLATSSGNLTKVTLVFNEWLLASTAQNIANYTVTDPEGNSVAVVSAVLQADLKTVILTLATNLCSGGPHIVTARNISDRSSPPATIPNSPGDSTTFVPASMPVSNLAGYWKFDEGTGNITADYSGGNHTGALMGPTSVQIPAWIAGVHTGALRFDGAVGQWVQATADVSETEGAVAFWFRTSDPDAGIISLATGPPDFFTPPQADRTVYLSFGNLGGYTQTAAADLSIESTGTNYADNTWRHAVYMWGGPLVGQKLYVNGTLVRSGALNGPSLVDQSLVLIGYSPQGFNPFFTGDLDDVRVFNRALTQDEITALQSQNMGPEVDAGPDQSVQQGAAFAFQGVVRDDSKPVAATHLWTLLSGPGAATINNPTSPTSTVTFGGTLGLYRFHLESTDTVFRGCDTVDITLVAAGVLDVSFVQAASAVPETQPGTINIPVTLSAAPAGAVTVTYTLSGTATGGGTDYTLLTPLTLNFASGQQVQNIQVTFNNDILEEVPNETIIATITGATGAILVAPTVHTLTILDDDAPRASFLLSGSDIGENSFFSKTIEVVLNRPATVPGSVQYTVTGGTATGGGVDYTFAAGTINFAVGEDYKTFDITPVDDAFVEGDETVILTLSNFVNVNPGQFVDHTLNILDNELSATVQFQADPASSTGGESVSPVNLTVVLSPPLSPSSGATVTVDYQVSGGSAVNGGDYTVLGTGTLTFTAGGPTTQDVVLSIIDDGLDEVPETLVITLFNPVGAALETRDTYTYTIDESLGGDDPTPVVGFVINSSSAGEGISPALLDVTLSSPSGNGVVVDYTVAGGTATNGPDYTLTSGQIIFPEGVTSMSIPIPIIDDLVIEPDETIIITLSGPQNATPGPILTHTYTIIDDDGPTITIDNPVITEGDAGTVNLVFTATIAPTPGGTVQVTATVVAGTATSNVDFTQVGPFTLTFNAGTTVQTVTVQIIGDLLDEADETVLVLLSGVTGGGVIGTPQGVGTITDNDPLPTISIATPAAQLEGDGPGTTNMTFAVTLGAVSGRDVTVTYTTNDGTAVQPGDYTLTSGTLTIPAGQPGGTIIVPIVGDTAGEANETFTVTLSNPQGASFGTSSATGTINNDDPPALSVSNVTRAENADGGATTAFTFDISLSISPTAGDVVVSYQTVNGSAVAPGDFTAVVGGSHTFPMGTAALTHQVTVLVNDDALNEVTETFTLQATVTAGVALPATANGIGTITDNDTQPTVSIAFASLDAGPGNVEGTGAGTTNAIFNVTLSAQSGQAVTVNFATADGTVVPIAVQPADYTQTNPLVTFAAETLTLTQQVLVPIVRDPSDEFDETFTATLSGAVNATISGSPTATATIPDDDADPTLSISSPSATEGNNVNFTVTLSAASGKTVTVDFATADGAGPTGAVQPLDYTQTVSPPPVTFTPGGSLTQTIVVPTVQDLLDEAPETFTVTLSNPGNATIASGTGVGTINDDDASPELSITSSVTVTEGDAGTVNAVFTVTLSAPSGQTVTVNFNTADGGGAAGATQPADYVQQSNTLTFSPGGPLTQTITVLVQGDTLDELNQTFTVTLSGETNATLAAGQSVGIGTIADDDATPVITVSNPSSPEGTPSPPGSLTFVVTMTGRSELDVTLDRITQNGSADASDYTPLASATITFAAAGSPSQTQDVIVTITPDGTSEPNETLFLNLTALSSNAVFSPVGATLQAVGTILDDDGPPSLSVNDVTVNEGVGIATFTVTLLPSNATPVDVTVSTGPGTATAGADYNATPVPTLVQFAVGETSKTVQVSIVNDTLSEASETFFVNLSGATGGAAIADAQGTGTIIDNEPLPGLSINNVTAVEGNAGTTDFVFTVTLAVSSSQTISVDVGTAPGSASAGSDYTAAPTPVSLTFSPGETLKLVTVSVAGDTADEPNETFFVNLTNPVGATLVDGQGLGTITNDDNPTVTIDNVSVPENAGPAVFTVTLSGPSVEDISVTFSTSNGAATASLDYTAVTNGTVLITAGNLTGSASITILNDAIAEPSEGFFVNLTNATNSTIADNQGSGTILDDDGPPQLSINDVTVTEGGVASFTVTLLPASAGSVTVNVATSPGTAAPGSDYNATPNPVLVTFTAGQTSRPVTVTTLGDSLSEAAETFFVNLSGATGGATIIDAQGTGTITDNDAQPTLTVNDITVAEGAAATAATATFTVTLSTASGQTVTVQAATANGTAIAPGDYVAVAATLLSFAPGETTKTVSVTVNGDATDEADETYFVTLSSASGATILDGQGLGTITNDDNPSLSIDDVSVVEGAAGTVNATFTLTLSAPSAQDVTGTFSTANQTATAGSDYAAAVFTPFTILTGATTLTINVVVNGDPTDEPNETFLVNLAGVLNATVLDGQGVGTILDDDGPPQLTISDVTVNEGGIATFVVNLLPASLGAVSVDVATAPGTAAPGTDYNATPNPLTVNFAAGQTSQAVTVTTLGDALSEASETFLVNLSNPSGATIADGQGVGTITDNDPLPTLTVNNVTVAEGAGATTTNATFTVTLSTASGQTVTVQAATANATAVAPGDYTANLGATVTFAPGETVQIFSVTVNGDGTDEPDETFLVNLSSPAGAVILDSQGVGTITNDDNPTVSISDASVAEGNAGTTPMAFSVVLSAPSAQNVTGTFSTANQTATSGSDYVAAAGVPFTIFAGATSATINVAVNGDAVAEPNETFLVNLAGLVNATILDGQGVGTILDDDGSPQLSINDVTVTEGGVATFTVSLLPASAGTVTVNVATAPGTAVAGTDYNATPNPVLVTFTAGQTSQSVTVTTVNDTLSEASETFFVTLSGGTGGAAIADAQGTGTITDNDTPPTLSVNDVTVAEGAAASTTTASFTVTLSTASGQTVTVQAATANGTAAAPGDYVAVAPTTVSFAPGELVKTFTVTVNGDGTDEADETYFVNLTSPAGATLLDGQGTGTITNDDNPTISINDVSVTEGNAPTTVNAVFTLTLSGVSTQNVTGTFSTANQTAVAPADYVAAVSTPFTILAGATTTSITVVVNGDGIDENSETYFVNLAGVVNATVLDGQGVGTIVDDDGPPDFTINDVTVTEGDAVTVNAVFTVSLSAPLAVGSATVDVSTNPPGGTATSGTDYQALATTTLTFISGGPLTQQVTVLVNGDTLDEPNETFIVTLSNAVGAGIADNQGLGTITDDDANPGLSINDVTVSEGNAGTVNATFTVTLSAASAQTVTVNVATAPGTATAGVDYVAAPTPALLTFNPGVLTQQVTVTVNGDTADEVDETFLVNLLTPVNATLTDGQGVGTITNDDNPTITVNNPSVAEGNAGTATLTFTITLSSASLQDVTVQYATADGTLNPATVGSDYLAATGTATIIAGSLSAPVNVTVNGDTNGEPDETLFLNLSVPTNATIADNQGLGTIVNDDLPALTIANVTVTEGDAGTTNANFTVTLSGTNLSGVTVNFATANGTATAGLDFAATAGTLNIPAGQLTGTISVPVLGDTVDELNETFVVNLSGATGAVIADNQATGTITDDDGPTVSINDVVVTEGNAGTVNAVFTVTLSAASPQDITYTWSTANGTATGGSDYAIVPPTGMTIVAGNTTQQLTVVVSGDAVDEADETFLVNLSSITGATASDAQGQGTITNDDNLVFPVQVPAPPAGTEGAFYSYTFGATGGVTPYTWSLEPGSSPAFPFNLDPSTGTISGTAPAVAGATVFTFTIRVTDAQAPSETATRTFTITINDATAGNPAVNNVNPPAGMVGAAYTHTFSATGGTPPYTLWTLTGALPVGLSFNTSTGTLTGTPASNQAGSYPITLTVADSVPNSSAPQGLTLTINPNPVVITTPALVDGAEGSPYSQTIATSGGLGPNFTWSLIGTLPSGLNLSGTTDTATISGTPAVGASGSYTFTVQVVDGGQPPTVSDTQLYSISIAAAGGTLTVTTASLPGGTVGQTGPNAYSTTLSATGGTPGYTWSATGLPAGLTVAAATGIISGTPAVSGVFSVNVTVTDLLSATASRTLSLSIATAPVITTTTLPDALQNQAYSQQIVATGGVGPYAWSVGAGLPAGITLSATSGLLSGTTAATGTFNFTVTVTEANGVTDSQALTLVVLTAPAPGTVTVLTSLLPVAQVGVPYSIQFQAAGGVLPYTWSTSGANQAALATVGLVFGANGVLSGTPTGVATIAGLTFTVTDSTPVTPLTDTSVAMTLTVIGPLSVATTSLPDALLGAPYSVQLVSSGASGATTWSIIAGTLPPGLGLVPATGVISGAPAVQGPFIFTVQVADGMGRTAQRQLSINVVLTLTVTLFGGSSGKDCSIGSVAETPWAGMQNGWVVLAAALLLLALARRRRAPVPGLSGFERGRRA